MKTFVMIGFPQRMEKDIRVLNKIQKYLDLKEEDKIDYRYIPIRRPDTCRALSIDKIIMCDWNYDKCGISDRIDINRAYEIAQFNLVKHER